MIATNPPMFGAFVNIYTDKSFIFYGFWDTYIANCYNLLDKFFRAFQNFIVLLFMFL